MTAVSRWACPCRMGSVIEMTGWWGGEAGARSDKEQPNSVQMGKSSLVFSLLGESFAN